MLDSDKGWREKYIREGRYKISRQQDGIEVTCKESTSKIKIKKKAPHWECDFREDIWEKAWKEEGDWLPYVWKTSIPNVKNIS